MRIVLGLAAKIARGVVKIGHQLIKISSDTCQLGNLVLRRE